MTKLGGSEPSEILPKLAWGGGPPKAVEGQWRCACAISPPSALRAATSPSKLGEELETSASGRQPSKPNIVRQTQRSTVLLAQSLIYPGRCASTAPFPRSGQSPPQAVTHVSLPCRVGMTRPARRCEAVLTQLTRDGRVMGAWQAHIRCKRPQMPHDTVNFGSVAPACPLPIPAYRQ